MIEELLPGIFSVDHRVADGKNGILFGERITLAIDGGTDPEEGEAMAAFIRARRREPDRLVLTHAHGDHVLGAAALAGGEVFAHSAATAVIRRQLPGWAQRSGESVAETEARVIRPTITFTSELRIDLGGRTARLFPTPGHSEDSICLFLEEEHVLFAGDTVVTGIVPAIGDGNGAVLETSLRRLLALEIDLLVPGHGPVRRGREAVRDWLAWMIDYLTGVRAFARAALARGEQPEAVADAVTYERFIGNRLPIDRHGMPRRHRHTVTKIIEEVLGEGYGRGRAS
jgi:cyclase